MHRDVEAKLRNKKNEETYRRKLRGEEGKEEM